MAALVCMSHPTRDVWVEIRCFFLLLHRWESHPTRDVWVEIYRSLYVEPPLTVTSHTGCVSRNRKHIVYKSLGYVTSHTGCVSRNTLGAAMTREQAVTSHTGCVSRNFTRLDRWFRAVAVTSHTGCVSRNSLITPYCIGTRVTSHTGCVSRNLAFVAVVA